MLTNTIKIFRQHTIRCILILQDIYVYIKMFPNFLAAQDFASELIEIQNNKSKPIAYSNYYTTKTIVLGSVISLQFLNYRLLKVFGRINYYLEQ